MSRAWSATVAKAGIGLTIRKACSRKTPLPEMKYSHSVRMEPSRKRPYHLTGCDSVAADNRDLPKAGRAPGVTRRWALSLSILAGLGLIVTSQVYSRMISQTNGVWRLSSTHMTQELYAAVWSNLGVFGENSGSSLFLWGSDGKLLAEVRSKGDIATPFVTKSGRVPFVEELNRESLFRLVALNPPVDAPAYEVLYETDLYIGGPIEIEKNGVPRILFLVGHYYQGAAGNPVPTRMIAELGPDGMSIFSGAAFATASSLCQTQGGDMIAVSMGAKVGGASTGSIESRFLYAPEISSRHDLFSIRLGDRRVEVEPLEFNSTLPEEVSSADCSVDSDIIVVQTVEFSDGGRTLTVSGIKKTDGSIIYSHALPRETDSTVPNLLGHDEQGLSIGLITSPEIVGGGSSKDVSAMVLDDEGVRMIELSREAPGEMIEIGD